MCLPFRISPVVLQVAKEIWVCEKQGVHPWRGDIQSYKQALKKKAMKYLAIGRK